jgi:thiosulfate dehydrogenase (quinone) large subunit
MNDSTLERGLVFFFRIAMGWTFLYAGLSQLTDPHFTVAGFLAGTKTFHDQLAWFAIPAIAPYTTFLVKWGHTLIGLSLISGCMVRLSSPFGIFLMAIYYCAHMDWPYIEGHVNFIMDYHLVYVAVLIFLMAKHAGHVWGLDGWLEKLPVIARRPLPHSFVE